MYYSLDVVPQEAAAGHTRSNFFVDDVIYSQASGTWLFFYASRYRHYCYVIYVCTSKYMYYCIVCVCSMYLCACIMYHTSKYVYLCTSRIVLWVYVCMRDDTKMAYYTATLREHVRHLCCWTFEYDVGHPTLAMFSFKTIPLLLRYYSGPTILLYNSRIMSFTLKTRKKGLWTIDVMLSCRIPSHLLFGHPFNVIIL